MSVVVVGNQGRETYQVKRGAGRVAAFEATHEGLDAEGGTDGQEGGPAEGRHVLACDRATEMEEPWGSLEWEAVRGLHEGDEPRGEGTREKVEGGETEGEASKTRREIEGEDGAREQMQGRRCSMERGRVRASRRDDDVLDAMEEESLKGQR